MLISIPELVAKACENVQRLDAASAYTEGRACSGLFIDVREPGEVAMQSIQGSINIPRGVLEMKMTELYNDSETPLYIHCATGGRAALAAEQLQRLGYTRVKAISCALDVIKAVEEKHR